MRGTKSQPPTKRNTPRVPPRPDGEGLLRLGGYYVDPRGSPSTDEPASSFLHPSHGVQRTYVLAVPNYCFVVVGREDEAVVVLHRAKLNAPHIRAAAAVSINDTDIQTMWSWEHVLVII